MKCSHDTVERYVPPEYDGTAVHWRCTQWREGCKAVFLPQSHKMQWVRDSAVELLTGELTHTPETAVHAALSIWNETEYLVFRSRDKTLP